MIDKKINISYLGRMDYASAVKIQENERTRVLSSSSCGSVFLLEHVPAVITLGRHAARENLKVKAEYAMQCGYQVAMSSRGGDITVHEPGQLVVYYVLPVKSKDTGRFIRNLVSPVADMLNSIYKCDVYYDASRPGIWHGNEKLCFSGFDLTGKVSMHGISINICNTLDGFSYIVPCGMEGISLTTLCRLAEKQISVREVAHEITTIYEKLFND
ncbi:MAG: lipoyl(octanoyl) transferase [Spirochaetae bacterium HGW-Spirochaetae-1]|jgi:lipoate-protein ligase B|nr:MAG: lipoyl(octanoyl) transferase [Spirochaetae bacterium HGW-Spirochaetae-1]